MTDQACIFNIQKFSLHDGPGIRSVVFFKCCPLKCYWCANPESQNGKPEPMWDNHKKALATVGEYKSIDAILMEVLKDQPFYEESGGGVTLSGGEVLYQADAAIKLLKKLKQNGIHTACETTGYVQTEVFEDFLRNVDLLYFDIKHYDSAAHKRGVGVPNELILKNLSVAIHQHPNVVVRIPIIPFYNDRLTDAEGFVKLFCTLGVQHVELLPFHQFGENKYQYLDREYAMRDIPQLHTEDLKDFQAVLAEAAIHCQAR